MKRTKVKKINNARSICLWIMCVCVIVSVIFASKSNAYEVNDEEEKYAYDDIIHNLDDSDINLVTNYDENNMLCKKLEYDRNNYVTQLSQEKEQMLNEVGIFDSEINNFQKEIIQKIEKAECIEVSVEYTEINEEGNNEMSFEQISQLISEGVEDGTIEYEEEKTVLSKALEIVGIKPAVVYAQESAPAVSKSGALKQIIIASQEKKNSVVDVEYQATWLKTAKDRGLDVMGVVFDNLDITPNSWECRHTAIETTWNNTGGVWKSVDKGLVTMPKTYDLSTNGIAFEVNLFGKYSEKGIVEYSCENIQINFTGKREDKSKSCCTFISDYHHLLSYKVIEPSVSFSKGGISVSVSANDKVKYHKVKKQAILQYKFK